VDALLNARAALLLALRDGPGYGIGLVGTLREKSLGRVRLSRGNVYTALRALEAEGLARSWAVVPGARRGSRTRVYYELTPRGLAVAQVQARALAAILGSVATATDPRDRASMATRIRRSAELSAFVLDLGDRMRRRLAR
jgi:PadR family transcriptional regulator PadR